MSLELNLELTKNYRQWQQKLNLFRPQLTQATNPLPLLPPTFLPFGARLPGSPLHALSRVAPFQNYINQVSLSYSWFECHRETLVPAVLPNPYFSTILMSDALIQPDCPHKRASHVKTRHWSMILLMMSKLLTIKTSPMFQNNCFIYV